MIMGVNAFMLVLFLEMHATVYIGLSMYDSGHVWLF